MIRRVMTNPSVIAGLKWPPEMWPRFVTMIPIARPLASATATRLSSVGLSADRDPCATADEDQRERADELGDSPADNVLIHGRGRYGAVRTAPGRVEAPRARGLT